MLTLRSWLEELTKQIKLSLAALAYAIVEDDAASDGDIQ